eukprot:1286572-Alexandrium_andersonii.AAC.1
MCGVRPGRHGPDDPAQAPARQEPALVLPKEPPRAERERPGGRGQVNRRGDRRGGGQDIPGRLQG